MLLLSRGGGWLKQVVWWTVQKMNWLFLPLWSMIWRWLIVRPYNTWLRLNRWFRHNPIFYNLRLLLRQPGVILFFVVGASLIIGWGNLQTRWRNDLVPAGQNNLIFPLVKNEFNITIIEESAASPILNQESNLAIKPANSERGIGIPQETPITFVAGVGILKPNLNNTESSVAQRHQIETYRVQPGDTLALIAQRFGLNLNTLLWENKLRPGSLLKVGQSLTILPVDGITYRVQRGDTLASIARRYHVPVDALTAANAGENLSIGQTILIPGGVPPTPTTPVATRPRYTPPPIPTDIQPTGTTAVPSNSRLQWPTVHRRITQYFSWRHTGVDIADRVGTPLYAAEDGLVITAGWNNGGYGNYIIIDHGGNLHTLYGHASRLFVKAGDRVTRGQEIAAMGSTGRSTGPHIHFEVRINNRVVNPLLYIR